MPMHPNCVAEVASAIGRQPTASEIKALEDGMRRAMRDLARTEPNWPGMTGAQRLQAAAQMAADAKIADASKSAERKALNLIAQQREAANLTARAQVLAGRGKKNAMHAALFERFRQIDNTVAAIRNDYMADLTPAIQAVAPKFWGWMDDPAKIREFARAVIDGKASTPEMGRAAKVYIDTMEAIRTRANAAGADIGQLDYGYMPQPHDTGSIARAGKDGWMQKVFPLLARDRYVRADGSLMDDAEVMALLDSAYDTLSTEGLNKRVPGQSRGGSRASRFDDKHRVLHFKDADSYLAYNADFGRGSALSAIHGHIGMMSKNIAMMEEFGSNPGTTYRMLKDLAEQKDSATGVHESLGTLDMVWDTLSGTTAQPVNATMARFFQGARFFTSAVKLQGVMLSAITDAPLQVLVALSGGMPIGKAVGSLFAGVGKGKRRLAHQLGIGMDEIAGEMARWHQDFMAQGWTSKLANTTMRLTLIEGWTNSLRRGYALTLSQHLGDLRARDWDTLGEIDRRTMEASGVTEADWKVWQQAQPGPNGMLTRDGIRAIPGISDADANRAVARLLGFLDSEARTAVLSPDISTRAGLQQGTRAGTVGGELLRSMMLFKSFPVAIVQKHLRRLENIPSTQGKVAYSVAMMTGLTLFGAAAMSLKDLAAGKDPRDPADPKFWMAAFVQGGGVGIFGDILYTGMGGNARGGQSNWTSLAGPVLGNAFDGMNVIRKGAGWVVADENADEARRQFGAEALRFVRGNTPLVNLWYLRAGIDHMVVHDLQEQLSPGYLSRMERRSRNEWGQDYWWEPGETLPDRFPDVGSNGD